MTARLALAVLVALAAPAAAQPAATPADPAAALAGAADALAAGEHERAADLAAGVAARPDATRPDRAEAHRLLGLARFFLGDTAGAEEAFVAYLKLDLDGRLDPAVTPPEAVTFFEDVRARHGAELRTLRPRQKRYALLNLIPPGGQLQNREPAKAWAIGGLEVALLGAHLSSYFVLRSWCQREDFTCASGGTDVPDRARTLRTVNYLSGAALVAVYVYGVVDGFRGFRRRGREARAPIVGVTPAEGGVVVGATLRF